MLDKKDASAALTLLKNHYHNTSTALKFQSSFQLLISTMLAAQSTDIRVNIVTKKLFEDYPDAKSLLKLSIQALEEKIKTVGLYRSKAKNIIATCEILVNQFNGGVPLTREELVKLPGVGRKTANVVLSITTDFEAIAVDTHVFRVSNRLGLASANNVRKTEDHLMQNIPKSQWSAAHHWLIWHGRKICKARKPLCKECFLQDHCVYFRNLQT